MADEVGKRGFSRLLVPVAGSVLGAGAWWEVMHSATFEASMVWLGVEYLLAECW